MRALWFRSSRFPRAFPDLISHQSHGNIKINRKLSGQDRCPDGGGFRSFAFWQSTPQACFQAAPAF
jgi:hypothetical protein